MTDLSTGTFLSIFSGSGTLINPETIFTSPILLTVTQGVPPQNQWHRSGWITQEIDTLIGGAKGQSRQIYFGSQLINFAVYPYKLKFEAHPWISNVTLSLYEWRPS